MNVALDDLLKIVGRQTVELEVTRAENAALLKRIEELAPYSAVQLPVAPTEPKPDVAPSAPPSANADTLYQQAVRSARSPTTESIP